METRVLQQYSPFPASNGHYWIQRQHVKVILCGSELCQCFSVLTQAHKNTQDIAFFKDTRQMTTIKTT